MKKHFLVFVLILLTIPFLWPLFQSGFIATDDGLWAIVRQASIHNELRQGQFPVRWSSSLNNGYGYPLFNFSYPGPYYIGEIFKLVGFDFIWSVKMLMIVSTIVSILGMYLFAKELWKNEIAGAIAAIFYISGPYRLVNTYIRGSVGELVAFALFPFICWAGLRLLTTGKRRYLIIGAILLAALVISHNIMALLFIPFFVCFLIGEIFLKYVKFSVLIKTYIEEFQNRKKGFKDNYDRRIFLNHIHLVLLMIIIGIGLSAFFWLPAISELKYTMLFQSPLTNIKQEFSKTTGLFVTPFDNRSNPDPLQQQSFRNGMLYLHGLVLLTVVLILLFYRKDYQVVSHKVVLYAIGYLVACLFLLPLSQSLWGSIPGLKIVDFPWRMYGIIIFIRPIIMGAIALIPRGKVVGILLACIPLVYGISGAGPLEIVHLPNDFYATNQATTTSANEYLTPGVRSPLNWEAQKIKEIPQIESNNFAVDTLSERSTQRKYIYKSDKQTEIQLAIMYFPGWTVKIDDRAVAVMSQENNGVIKVPAPAGTHTIEAVFQNTPIRTTANTISIATAITICLFFGIQYTRGKKFIF